MPYNSVSQENRKVIKNYGEKIIELIDNESNIH